MHWVLGAMLNSLCVQAVITVTACLLSVDAPILFRCAPNALYVYLKCGGADVTLGKLDEELGGKDVPVSLVRVKEICEQYGIPSRVRRINNSETERIPFPAIAFLPPTKADQPGHFVVLLESSNDQVTFIDGTTGKLSKWHHNTLWRQWKDSGVVIVADQSQDYWFEFLIIVSGAAVVVWLICRGR